MDRTLMQRRQPRRPIASFATALAAVAMLVAGTVPASAGPEDTIIAALLQASDVQATGVGPSSIVVSWLDGSLVETTFRIEIADDEAGPYTQIAMQPCIGRIAGQAVPQTGRCLTQIQVGPSARPEPVFVRVVPLLANGSQTLLEGPPSKADPALLGPLAPTNLKCNGGGAGACVNVTSVNLTWTDNSDENEFWVMRARAQTNPNFGLVPHAVVPANTPMYTDYLGDFDSTYWYRVVAVRRANIPRLDETVTVEESFSNASGSSSGGGGGGGGGGDLPVETPPVPAPSDPSGLSVEFVPPRTAKLTWTDDELNPSRTYLDEDGWFVEQGPDGENWSSTLTSMKRPGPGTVTFIHDNVPPDIRRCYRVRAWRSGPAYSAFTNVACLESIPAKPTGLTATALSNAKVELGWIDRSDSEALFSLQRCFGTCGHSGSWTEIATTAANATMALDETVVGTTTYSYRIFAKNSAGSSAASNIATVTTPNPPLSTPLNLSAVATGSHQNTLTWTDTTSNETGFRIEFKYFGEWTELEEIGAKAGSGGSVTYIDEIGLGANDNRCYRVRSVKVMSMSDPSNVACAQTLGAAAPNGTPTSVTAAPLSNTRIDVSFLDTATNEDSFRIEAVRFANQACPQNPTGKTFTPIGSGPRRIGTGSTTVAVEQLQPHSAYFFRVIAVNRDGESGISGASGCAQTFGPPLPIFLDPAADGDTEATRCAVTIEAPAGLVDRIKLTVNAHVPQTGYGTQEIVFAEEPESGNQWRIPYQFRRGVNYRLIARSIGFAPSKYTSGEAQVYDIKVLADCPIEPDPI